MKIKRFNDFILENQYYNPINESDIVPGVPYNLGTDRSDKLGNMKANIMADILFIQYLLLELDFG
jgi:hypothetical protein